MCFLRQMATHHLSPPVQHPQSSAFTYQRAPVQLQRQMATEAGTAQRASKMLVPRLLALFSSPYEDAKCLAVSIMNLLAGGAPSAVVEHMDTCAPASDHTP